MPKIKGQSQYTSARAIPVVAEMIFNGASQGEVAEHLGVTPQRVSQYMRTDLYRETLDKLEKIKNRCVADYAQQQVDRYNDEFEEWFKLSKTMSGVNTAAYQKLMKTINSALDAAIAEIEPKTKTNADRIKVAESIKNLCNLTRAAMMLEQQINAAFNQRLGTDELSKRLSADRDTET